MCRIWSVWLSLLLYIHYSYGGTPFFRKDYEFNADTQNFYKIHTVARTWTEAKTRCQQEGAALFAPDTKQDYDAVVALMQTKLPMWQWAFIGIHDLLSEGEFITVDGQNLEDIYHVWGEGEPNNSGGNENCVIMRKAGIINDDNCLNRYPFVCKKSRATLEWNVLCDMPDQDYLFDKDLGKCYKLHLHPKNWTEAFGVCAAEQSYLAVINSKAESDYLRKKVADAPKNTITEPYLSGAVHLGYHNRLGEGFTTVQGVPLQNSGFAVWGGGQPDNSGGTEKCGSMFYDGTLNDISCHVVCIFICEHDIGFLSSSVDERIKDNVA